MGTLAGYDGYVYVAAQDAVSFTEEATTDEGDGLTFAIDDGDKRYWDDAVTVTVERDSGGGWGTVSASEYEIQHVGGKVIFGSDQTGNSVRVTGEYLPVSAAVHGTGWSAEASREILEVTEFQSGWKTKIPGMMDATAEFERWYPDGGSEFMEQIAAGAKVVLVLYPSFATADSSRFEGFAVINGDSVSTAVDSVVDESISFDVSGELYRV